MSDIDRVNAFIRLSAFAMSLIPNWADADDVLQQTNLVLWKKFDQFELGSNFFAWASRILYLEAKEFRKKQLRSKLLFSDAFVETVADEAERSSEELAERQRLMALCVAQLKGPQRELLRMRYEEGGDVEAIAGAMDRSVKTIYNALGGVRKALLACIERQLKGRVSREP
jgi:RNA polymerase sigma-70 factor (ECF subfamily)